MNRRKEQGRGLRPTMIALMTVLCLLLTACGGGDGDEDANDSDELSSAQPTVQAPGTDDPDADESTPQDNGSLEPPTNIDLSSPAAPGTSMETDDDAGPSPVPGNTTPIDSAVPASGLIASTPGADDTPAAGQPPTGDGTTGAPPPEQAGSGTGTPAVGESTPGVVPGTAVAGGEPLVVDGCVVEDVPAFTAATSTYRVNSELNFRSGPGTDCDLIGQEPLAVSTLVEVIGGSVVRQGEDGIEWVQVRIGEETGWVALEFLEAAE